MTDNVKPFPPMLTGESTPVSAEEAGRINAHCESLHTEVLRLRGVNAEYRAALDYLLAQTVDQDLKYGIALSEGEEDARQKALALLARDDMRPASKKPEEISENWADDPDTDEI